MSDEVVYPFLLKRSTEEVEKALIRLKNTIYTKRKGACLMSDDKRAKLRKKRKKKNKK